MNSVLHEDLNQNGISQELASKIASENITLNKEITKSLESEASDLVAVLASKDNSYKREPSFTNESCDNSLVKENDVIQSQSYEEDNKSLISDDCKNQVSDNGLSSADENVLACKNKVLPSDTQGSEVTDNGVTLSHDDSHDEHQRSSQTNTTDESSQQRNETDVNGSNSQQTNAQSLNSKSDDLNVLIQGLETLNKQVVTNNNPNLGQYRKVLSSIITPNNTDSAVVPEKEELKTVSSIKQLSELRSNHELQDKFVLISDVHRYINHIYSVLKGYKSDAEALKEGKSKSSHIEGMSSIISDMTYRRNGENPADDTPSITGGSISKLPSFNDKGEIVATPDSLNISADQNLAPSTLQDDTLSNEESYATSKDDIINNSDKAMSDQQSSQIPQDPFKKAVEALSADSDRTVASDGSNTAEDQILTPQTVELTPDELLRKAQDEALRQLQSDQILNQKLKEEAEALNKHVDPSQYSEDNNPDVFTADFKDSLNAQLPDAIDDRKNVSKAADITGSSISTQENLPSPDSSNTDISVSEPAGTGSLGTDSDNQSITSGNVRAQSDLHEQKLSLERSDDPDRQTVKNTLSSPDFSQVQSYIPLSKAVALELQKINYSDTVPVIKVHTYSKSLELAVSESLRGNSGESQNVNTGYNPVSIQSKDSSGDRRSNEQVSVPSQTDSWHESSLENRIQGNTTQNTTVQNTNDVPPVTVDEVALKFPADVSERDFELVDNQINDENTDIDEIAESSKVTGSDLKFTNLHEDENSANTDGNPKKFRESTLKFIEEDQLFENKRLGRRLESCDFYDMVYAQDSWYRDILSAGYNDGPVYSALCYTNRIINPDDPYSWILQISSDFQLLFISPEFHHNLRTKFSFEQGHPVELKIEKIQGIPQGCPEDLARRCYIKEIEDTRQKMAKDKNIRLLLEHLGEDIRTLNLSLYKQEDSKAVIRK